MAGKTIERGVEAVTPNRFRIEYSQLQLARGRGQWIFRPERHDSPQPRTPRELAYYHTSRDLGLHVVAKLVRGSWNGELGTLQRVVPSALRSVGTLAGDARKAKSSRRNVDWDSLHAVAILHYVTRMHDDDNYNILVNTATDRKLVYHAIDGERTFGDTWIAPPFRRAVKLIGESFALGGPRELSSGLMDRLRRTDVERWRAHLLMDGIPPQEIELAVQRFEAVRHGGLGVILNAR